MKLFFAATGVIVLTAIGSALLWWNYTYKEFDLSSGKNIHAVLPILDNMSDDLVKTGNLVYSNDGTQWRCGLLEKRRYVSCKRDSDRPTWISNVELHAPH